MSPCYRSNNLTKSHYRIKPARLTESPRERHNCGDYPIVPIKIYQIQLCSKQARFRSGGTSEGPDVVGFFLGRTDQAVAEAALIFSLESHAHANRMNAVGQIITRLSLFAVLSLFFPLVY
ncbi:hypothetical protein WA026_021133 [Henosepilachna vigintioctopunctata]|uniref:Uncharacterized protein n=1 Tax=Henosepilachna vigintioctopunctata TaxID=420089 RepID=A0AAW1UDY5_9CUCU